MTSFGAGTTERVSRNPRSDHGTFAASAGPSSPDQLALFDRNNAPPKRRRTTQQIGQLNGTTFEDIFR